MKAAPDDPAHIWLDEHARRRPTRAGWTCGRELPVLRFRTDDLRRNGWAPMQTMMIPGWCGCSVEYQPVPEAPGWLFLVPIWDPERVANPLRRYGPAEPC